MCRGNAERLRPGAFVLPQKAPCPQASGRLPPESEPGLPSAPPSGPHCGFLPLEKMVLACTGAFVKCCCGKVIIQQSGLSVWGRGAFVNTTLVIPGGGGFGANLTPFQSCLGGLTTPSWECVCVCKLLRIQLNALKFKKDLNENFQ